MTRDEFLTFSIAGFVSAGFEATGNSTGLGSPAQPAEETAKIPTATKVSRFDLRKRIQHTGFGPIIAVKVKYIQILGTVLAVLYGVFIVFLYAAEPRSLEEVTSKAISTIESTVSKGQILTGTYEIDQARFNEGLAAFRADNFVVARDR